MDQEHEAFRTTPTPPSRRRRRLLVLAAAGIVLLAGGLGLAVSQRGEAAGIDEAALPAPHTGEDAAAPDWIDGTWLAIYAQPNPPDGAGTSYEIGSPDRPRVVVEAGRFVLRTECAAAAVPIVFGAIPATDIDAAKTSILPQGPWVLEGCALPPELAGVVEPGVMVAEGGPGYGVLELTFGDGTQVELTRQLSRDADVQYLLEPLLWQTRNLDVMRAFDHLADALPNDRWEYRGETLPTTVVVLGRVVGHEVVDRNGAIPSLEDPNSLHLRFQVEDSWGEPVDEEITVAIVTRGQDGDRMAAGFEALGRVVLILDPESPVYAYAPDAYAISDNGALIITIAADGTLALPTYDGYLADPYLEGIETLDRLLAALEEPVKDHGVLDPFADQH